MEQAQHKHSTSAYTAHNSTSTSQGRQTTGTSTAQHTSSRKHSTSTAHTTQHSTGTTHAEHKPGTHTPHNTSTSQARHKQGTSTAHHEHSTRTNAIKTMEQRTYVFRLQVAQTPVNERLQSIRHGIVKLQRT